MSQSDADHRVTVYSDYVCPFCYLGKASLETYLAGSDDPPAVEWHPFDLRGNKRGPDGEIDHDVDDGKDDEYFAEVRENVRRLAEKYDVEMALDFSRDVDSWDAQKLSLFVREEYGQDRFDRLHDALFEALWVDGRDIGATEVLVDVGETVGIPAEEVRSAIGSEDLDRRLEDRFEAARRRGVTGIPTFVYDDHAARGAVPPAQLRRLVGEE